jgi:hypothetical protein
VKKFPNLMNPMVHYGIHKSPPPVRILRLVSQTEKLMSVSLYTHTYEKCENRGKLQLRRRKLWLLANEPRDSVTYGEFLTN